uniref:Uncharacterized protein n=1 Tax=Timema cristinae TaxID=61476 RepID=A0A7R9CR43_TIMCR|nr:unnamed protein product [Timema cristinae]
MERRFKGLPVVSECAPQTARVSSNHSSMSVPRVPSPPPPEVNTPVAENWCYTQVKLVCPIYVGGDILLQGSSAQSTYSRFHYDEPIVWSVKILFDHLCGQVVLDSIPGPFTIFL